MFCFLSLFSLCSFSCCCHKTAAVTVTTPVVTVQTTA
jgi:hypothetical protein